MKEEYKELYLQHGGLMKAALEKTVCYLNAIGRLNREENVREETLNVFRLSCCTWYSLLENSVIQRELFRAESQTERTYSIRRLMVTMYEMNKHMFGVEAKTEKRSLWNAAKQPLYQYDSQACSDIERKVQAFKTGFSTMDTKNARGVFEHYAETPVILEHQMESQTANVVNIHMTVFIDIMCSLCKLTTHYIAQDDTLSNYIDASIHFDNDPEMDVNSALISTHKLLLMFSNKNVDNNSTFDYFYTFARKLSLLVSKKDNQKARLMQDMHQIQFLCSQIHRDLLYAQLSVVESESRIEEFLNIRYIFRRMHEGFKRIYGYNEKDHEKSYWAKTVQPYVGGLDDESILNQFNELEGLLDSYTKGTINDEGKRAVFAHIRVTQKSPEDYIPELFDRIDKTSIKSEFGLLTDFCNITMKLSNFTRDLCKEILKTIV